MRSPARPSVRTSGSATCSDAPAVIAAPDRRRHAFAVRIDLRRIRVAAMRPDSAPASSRKASRVPCRAAVMLARRATYRHARACAPQSQSGRPRYRPPPARPVPPPPDMHMRRNVVRRVACVRHPCRLRPVSGRMTDSPLHPFLYTASHQHTLAGCRMPRAAPPTSRRSRDNRLRPDSHAPLPPRRCSASREGPSRSVH